MDVPFHEVAQRLINHSMPRHGVLAAEGFRNDGEPPVAPAGGARTRVPLMLRALVLQLQRERLQRREAIAHGALDRVHHSPSPLAGVAALAGSSGRCLESHIACASTNASMRPMPPKSLKLTHVSVLNAWATHRLSIPLKMKNTPQAMQSLVHTTSGSSSPPSRITAFTRFWRKSSPPRKTTPASQ